MQRRAVVCLRIRWSGYRFGEKGRDFLKPDPGVFQRLEVSKKLFQRRGEVFVRRQDGHQRTKCDPPFDDKVSAQ